MDKLMIIGGSGLLGGHLIQFSKNEFNVVATYNNHPFKIKDCKSVHMDITDMNKTENTILKERPDLVILTAAQRNVDYCERNQKEVKKINIEGVKNVALASNKVQAKLVYLSTDLVFDGEKGHYDEKDTTNPVNYYGKTKLDGERKVQNTSHNYAIARVSVLYDWNLFDHTTNFVTWVYEGLKKGKQIQLFSDQYRNATYIKNACEALLSIYKKNEKGIFHVAGANCENRFYIGKKVAEIFGFDENLIIPCMSDEGNWLAKRPKKCCLNVKKMEKRLNVRPMSIEEGIKAMKEHIG